MQTPKYYIAVVGYKSPHRVNELINSSTSYLKTKKGEYDSSSNSSSLLDDNMCIEYLPCIASFASYQDEDEKIRYLQSLSIYQAKKDPNTDNSGNINSLKNFNISSLAPYIDDSALYGVIVLSSPTEDDMTSIQSFLNTFNNTSSTSNSNNKILVTSIPKSTTTNEVNKKREEIIEFIYNVTLDIMSKSKKKETITIITTEEAAGDKDNVNESLIEKKEEKQVEIEKPSTVVIDLSNNQYACRICRTILFNETQIQSPGHIPSKHTFHHYARNTVINNSTSICQNIFLSSPLSWCGTNEGKLSCPKCSSKVGLWKWCGSQCSCGTWVTPAIMVNKSRVDLIKKIM